MFIIQKNEASNKTIRMPNSLIEQLEEIAANEDISFNQLVVQCCEYALANLPKNEGKITCTEQFVSQKRQIKAAFQNYMVERSKATPQTVFQIFADAIYASQPRHAAVGVDLYSVLSGQVSIDEYQSALNRYFVEIAKGMPVDLHLEQPESFSYAEVTATFKTGDPGVKSEGFVNTESVPMSSRIWDVKTQALNECTIEYDTVTVNYDETAKVWEVTYSTANTLGNCQSVYMDENGVTLLIVYGE